MRLGFVYIAIFFLLTCHESLPKQVLVSRKKMEHLAFSPTHSLVTKRVELSHTNPQLDRQDSLLNLVIDTTSRAGKRAKILRQFEIDHPPHSATYEKMADLNYDGYNDYIIGYYGSCGTGIKNVVDIYLYDSKNESYQSDPFLSGLTNPTFYLKNKMITAFYIGHGGGSGQQYEWMNETWVETRNFFVNNQDNLTVWKVEYPLTGKVDSIQHHYMGIPPRNIMLSKYNGLKLW